MGLNDETLAVVAAVFNALLVAWAVRRLLGVPVGWPRTILLSLLVGVPANNSWNYLSDILDLPTTTAGSSHRDTVGRVLIVCLS